MTGPGCAVICKLMNTLNISGIDNQTHMGRRHPYKKKQSLVPIALGLISTYIHNLKPAFPHTHTHWPTSASYSCNEKHLTKIYRIYYNCLTRSSMLKRIGTIQSAASAKSKKRLHTLGITQPTNITRVVIDLFACRDIFRAPK